jgi:pimeloyl-ACP methyl ester carboxylesterase
MTNRSWIFLRGMVRGRGHWADFPDQFQKKFPNDKIELLDLPGNGERGAELSPLNISDFVPLIREKSVAIQNGQKVHCLALSLGAMVACSWMQKYPEDFVKTYLVCTSTSQYCAFYERFRPINYLKVSPLLIARSPRMQEKIILSMISNNKVRQKEVLAKLEQYSAQYPIRPINFFRQLRAAAKATFPTQNPGTVQLIGSWGDRLVSPNCTPKIAQAWGVEAKMHPWSGHDIPIDDPQWLLEQLI